jgi:hypothetical protein
VPTRSFTKTVPTSDGDDFYGAPFFVSTEFFIHIEAYKHGMRSGPGEDSRRLRPQGLRCIFIFISARMEVRMERQSVQMRVKLLGNYEKSINHLSQHLSRTKGLAPEAKKEIQSRINLLKKRQRRLEDRYKEIDDMREEAAQLKESVREIRASWPTSKRKSPTTHKGNHSQ